MSERKLKPSTSRRCIAASTTRAGSTTSVVSPCDSTVSTSAGTPSYVMRHPRVRGASWCDAPDLVGRRHTGLHSLVQPDDPLHQLLGPRRAAGDVDVDRDDLVDRLHDRVVVEHAAGARA